MVTLDLAPIEIMIAPVRRVKIKFVTNSCNYLFSNYIIKKKKKKNLFSNENIFAILK